MLTISDDIPVRPLNGGLFVSSGQGAHPVRTIESFELIFVHRGQLAMFEANTEFRLDAGDVLLLWPGRQHGGASPYPADLAFYWVHFELQSGGSGGGLQVPQHTRVSRPERLTELYRRFLDDQENGSLTTLLGGLLVWEMLVEVAVSSAVSDAPGNRLADLAAEFITTHAHEGITTADVAAALQCNPDYLGRVFKRQTGRTITAAIHHRQLRRAEQLLLHSTDTISAIARACGLADAAYLRRLFKRRKGVTPRQYRKLYARVHYNTE